MQRDSTMRPLHLAADFPHTETTPQSSPQQLYFNWIKAIHSLEPQAVANLHGEEALLWGTLATETKVGRPEIQTYFDWFLRRSSIDVKPLEIQYRAAGAGLVIANGCHEFSLGGKRPSDPLEFARLRFSFVFQLNSQTECWEIIDHHSSLSPDTNLSMESAARSSESLE